MKIFADGVVEYPSQSAAITTPTPTPANTATCYSSKNFAELCIEADEQGCSWLRCPWQPGGPQGAEWVRSRAQGERQQRVPHTITHLQLVRARYRSLQASRRRGPGNCCRRIRIETVELIKPYVASNICPWQFPLARCSMQAP